MANEQNLKRFGKEKPAPTSEEAKKAGSKGGKASAEARAEAKTTREIAKMLDSLAVTGKNKEELEQLGVPDDDQTQQTVRLVALHKKAMTGDVAAIKLWLEITGEAPTQKVSVEVNDDTREAYEKAAAAIKGKKGKGS